MFRSDSAGDETIGTASDELIKNRGWDGPFAEPNADDNYTGEYYVRCTGCGIEVLEQDQHRAHHRERCPHA
jgi:hypothetical protein